MALSDCVADEAEAETWLLEDVEVFCGLVRKRFVRLRAWVKDTRLPIVLLTEAGWLDELDVLVDVFTLCRLPTRLEVAGFSTGAGGCP